MAIDTLLSWTKSFLYGKEFILAVNKLFLFMFVIDNLSHTQPVFSWSTTTLQSVEAKLSLRCKTNITLYYLHHFS